MVILTYILFHVNKLNYILTGLISPNVIPQVSVETGSLWFRILKGRSIGD